jgi:hypothetical protein
MGNIILFLALIFVFVAIILWIFSYNSRKRKQNIKAIIFAVLGLLILIPPIYGLFTIYSFIRIDNFTKEFTQINQGFNHIHYSNKKSVTGMSIEINGSIDGQGKLSIIRPPYEENMGVIFELDREINEKIGLIDWYDPEFLIEFVPENEFVEGKISVKIKIH